VSLAEACDFSGISHRYITMELSAKVALCRCCCTESYGVTQLHRTRAPPVMPPSITNSAPVM
jgi:hypothetical protein